MSMKNFTIDFMLISDIRCERLITILLGPSSNHLNVRAEHGLARNGCQSISSLCTTMPIRVMNVAESLERQAWANFAKSSIPVVTRAPEKETQNRITGLICPFLPPSVFAKYLPARRMVGRGGGD